MPLLPEPNPRELLPPLLACLPTAFMSPQPPPDLLPTLSPLLRQRVQYMSNNANDGWLGLLSWDQDRAAKLPDVVERMQLEAHPVSGEIEVGDVRPAKYRRLDDETLHSRLEVEQFDLLPVYVWCENDEHGQTGPGWKLAELRSLEDIDDGAEWYDSPSEANDAANTRTIPVPQYDHSSNGYASFAIPADDEDEDDGSYWAAYDSKMTSQTPGKTSPNPPAKPTGAQQGGSSDNDYYARYGSVQPAMDSHGPDEDTEMGQTSLHGDSLVQPPRHSPVQQRSLYPADDRPSSNEPHDSAVGLSMPRPISPTSSHSSVDKLEERAAEMSNVDEGTEKAQRSIKQHISTDIKSLFRLARSVGMERSEFEEVVRRELDVLSMLERDE